MCTSLILILLISNFNFSHFTRAGQEMSYFFFLFVCCCFFFSPLSPAQYKISIRWLRLFNKPAYRLFFLGGGFLSLVWSTASVQTLYFRVFARNHITITAMVPWEWIKLPIESPNSDLKVPYHVKKNILYIDEKFAFSTLFFLHVTERVLHEPKKVL